MTRFASIPSLLFAAFLSTTGLACVTSLPSPPTNPLALEAPRALEDGRTSIAVSGGVEAGGFALSSGVGVQTVAVSHGMGQGIDANVSATAMRVGDGSFPHGSPLIGAARVGTKIELGTHDAAITAGVGGGTWTAGGFFSPDVGLIVGYDNRYLIPFVSLRGAISAPVGANDVDTTPSGSTPGSNIAKPYFTKIVSGTVGMRVPLGEQTHGVSGALSAGLSITNLYYDGGRDAYVGLGCGAEIAF